MLAKDTILPQYPKNKCVICSQTSYFRCINGHEYCEDCRILQYNSLEKRNYCYKCHTETAFEDLNKKAQHLYCNCHEPKTTDGIKCDICNRPYYVLSLHQQSSIFKKGKCTYCEIYEAILHPFKCEHMGLCHYCCIRFKLGKLLNMHLERCINFECKRERSYAAKLLI